MNREERVDAVADHAHDLAFAPARVAHDVALLERAEHRPLDALDLERAAAARGVATAQRFFEERLAGLGIAAAASGALDGQALGAEIVDRRLDRQVPCGAL